MAKWPTPFSAEVTVKQKSSANPQLRAQTKSEIPSPCAREFLRKDALTERGDIRRPGDIHRN